MSSRTWLVEEPIYIDSKEYEIMLAKFTFEKVPFIVPLLDYEEDLELDDLQAFLEKQEMAIDEYLVSGKKLKHLYITFYNLIVGRDGMKVGLIKDIKAAFLSCFGFEIDKPEILNSASNSVLKSPANSKDKFERKIDGVNAYDRFDVISNDLGDLGKRIIGHLEKFKTPFKKVSIQNPEPNAREDLKQLLADDSLMFNIITMLATSMPIYPETGNELKMRKIAFLTYRFEEMKFDQKFCLKDLSVFPYIRHENLNIIGEFELDIFSQSTDNINRWWNVMQLPLTRGKKFGLSVIAENELLLIFHISKRAVTITPIMFNTEEGFYQFARAMFQYRKEHTNEVFYP